MNIILSVLFAIKIFYPVQIILPDMETSFQDINNIPGITICLDGDNRDCLWKFNYFAEYNIPYKTVYYFNDNNKLIQISITYYNNIVDEYKLSMQFIKEYNFQQAVRKDEQGNVVLHLYCCQPFIITNHPPKSGFIPKLPDLK